MYIKYKYIKIKYINVITTKQINVKIRNNSRKTGPKIIIYRFH